MDNHLNLIMLYLESHRALFWDPSFFIYMNDLPDNFNLQFVDDCIRYRPLVSDEDTTVLQRDLTRLSN